ncbi:MAG: SpoVG family protein [bacterium]|jgi:stage V sporulation protein G|nr:stage V sporulation protein G [Planctomycetota bacterium]HIL51204.1 stage V sporulation protein G [Planctomycetota bacterium]
MGSSTVKITEIRIKLVPGGRDKLRAFASVTLNGALVIRDIKVIDGGERLFVAMPSRKLCDRCSSCGGKNYVRARYCNDCGTRLARDRAEEDERGRPRLYSDIAHPIHQGARNLFQDAILAAYKTEAEASRKDGYIATTIDGMDYDQWGETAAD